MYFVKNTQIDYELDCRSLSASQLFNVTLIFSSGTSMAGRHFPAVAIFWTGVIVKFAQAYVAHLRERVSSEIQAAYQTLIPVVRSPFLAAQTDISLGHSSATVAVAIIEILSCHSRIAAPHSISPLFATPDAVLPLW